MMLTKERKETIYAIQASSVDELRASLPTVRARSSLHYVTLALNDPQIIVTPFTLEHVQKKEIKEQLMLRAVELLSLPLDAVGLEYQIFESNESKAKGVFACYPKDVLREYMSVLDETGNVPLKIVPAVAAGIDSFISQFMGQKGRAALLDFSKENIIYCAVFSNGQCDFLREIPYEDSEEIEREVVQSLRCACATSSAKTIDHIYCSGDIPKGSQVIEKLRSQFCENITQGYFIDAQASLRSTDNNVSLNLIQNSTFTIKQRRVIDRTTQAVLTACCIIAVVLGARIFKTESKIRYLQSSYTPADYERAVTMTRRLQHVKNEQ